MKTMQQLVRRFRLTFLRILVPYLVLSVIVAVGDILIARSTGSISDSALEHGLDNIVVLLQTMTLITAVKVGSSALRARLSSRGSAQIFAALRSGFAKHLNAISYKHLAAKSSGDVLALYTNDLKQACDALTTALLPFLSQTVLAIVALIFLFWMQPVQTLVYLVLYPLIGFFQTWISKPISELMGVVSRQRGEYNAVVLDSLQNTATIVACGLEDVMEERYNRSYDLYYRLRQRYISTFTKLVVGGNTLAVLPSIYVYLVSSLAVINGGMSLGGFIAYTTVIDFSDFWLGQLSQMLNQLRIALAGAQRILANTEEAWEHSGDAEDAGETKLEPVPHRAAIAMSGISFSYNGSDRVLEHIDLQIEAGERIALVGGSGSGKSSLMKLMLSLYEAEEGELSFYGRQASALPLAVRRGLVAYVPQDSFMFAASIRENITLGIAVDGLSPQEAEERLRECCRQADILSFIESLPQGFDTLLSESADNVSGGQRQRLAIARALYRQVPILMLDEATSALDPLTEAKILNMLQDEYPQLTTVLITHRLAAVAECDRILVMEQGRIIEEGSFDELMAASARFAELYRKDREEGLKDHVA